MARKIERRVEVINPEALRTERALKAFARIAFELHLYDDLLLIQKNSERKDK